MHDALYVEVAKETRFILSQLLKLEVIIVVIISWCYYYKCFLYVSWNMFFYILYRITMDKYEVGKFKVSKGICICDYKHITNIYIVSLE